MDDVRVVVVGVVGSSILWHEPHTLVLSNNNRWCPRSRVVGIDWRDELRQQHNRNDHGSQAQHYRSPPRHPSLLVAIQRDTAMSWIESEQRAEQKKVRINSKSKQQSRWINHNDSLVIISLSVDSMAMNHKQEGARSRVAVWMKRTRESKVEVSSKQTTIKQKQWINNQYNSPIVIIRAVCNVANRWSKHVIVEIE